MDGTKELSKTKGKGILLSKDVGYTTDTSDKTSDQYQEPAGKTRKRRRCVSKRKPYIPKTYPQHRTLSITDVLKLEMVQQQPEKRLTILDCKFDVLNNLNLHLPQKMRHGRFGPIVLAMDKLKERSKSVLKFYLIRNHDKLKAEEITKHFMKQIDILSELSHPNILSDVVPIRCDKYFAMYMPYCSHRSIQELIAARAQPHMHILTRLVLQLVDAVMYLHFKGIYHGSIIPSHLLIQSDLVGVKLLLTDFGHAKKPNLTSGLVTGGVENMGSPYMAPETKQLKMFDAYKVDIFAMGVSIWSLALWKYADEIKSRSLMATIYSWVEEDDNHDPKEKPKPGCMRFKDKVRFQRMVEGMLNPNPSFRWCTWTLCNYIRDKCASWIECSKTEMLMLDHKNWPPYYFN